ncbi:hypothetical protein BS47DRAFT_1353258 [Hydnum rufescens UP504]|uniref:Uncharacterized protein n=1 Tax=Hydnum rufescens UP504 TaxID=1448309 RepID=A0A9P6DPZ4_9AGAM|nr:hypothetical protein BS47DRAFT_1353258 [Hydnum rufescens UP504]
MPERPRRCFNSYRPDDDRETQPRAVERDYRYRHVRSVSNGAVDKHRASRSQSPRPRNNRHQVGGTPTPDPERTKLLNLLKDLDETGEINLTIPHSPSPGGPGTKNGPRPRLHSWIAPELLKNVGEVAAQMASCDKELQEMWKYHKEEFERIRNNANRISQCMEELMENLEALTSAMHRSFDSIEVQQQHAADSAHAVHNALRTALRETLIGQLLSHERIVPRSTCGNFVPRR